MATDNPIEETLFDLESRAEAHPELPEQGEILRAIARLRESRAQGHIDLAIWDAMRLMHAVCEAAVLIGKASSDGVKLGAEIVRTRIVVRDKQMARESLTRSDKSDSDLKATIGREHES